MQKDSIVKDRDSREDLQEAEPSSDVVRTEDEKIEIIAARILKEHKKAFLELAK